jgi:hypothetical protein
MLASREEATGATGSVMGLGAGVLFCQIIWIVQYLSIFYCNIKR